MKKLSFLLTILATLLLAGCTKSGGATMVSFDLMENLSNKYDTVETINAYTQYLNDSKLVICNLDNCYSNKVDSVISQMDAVISKYDNGVLSGTITLTCSIKVNGSHNLKTWTLTPKK